MNDALLQKFRQCCRERVVERALTINGDGLALSATILAKFVDGELQLNEERVLSLLSVAYGEPVLSRAIGYIRAAEKAYRSRDALMAALTIPQTSLRYEKSYEKAFRAFCAEELLAEGMKPQQLLKSLGLTKDDDSDGGEDDSDDEENDASDGAESDSASSSDDDFDSKHSRWPAGSPDGQGGEFVLKGSNNAGAATTRADISNYDPLSYVSSGNGSGVSGELQYHGDSDNDRIEPDYSLEEAIAFFGAGTQPAIQVTILNASSGDVAVVSAVSLSSCTIQVLNGGAGVARSVNVLVQGY